MNRIRLVPLVPRIALLAPRLVALAALALFLCAAAPAKKLPATKPATSPAAPAAPEKPVPGKFKSPKLRGWINDVPDTGQFLPDSVWVLEVGPRVTTVGAFIERWFGSYPEYRPAPDSLGRVKFLQSLKNKDVLGLTALAVDHPMGFEDRLALREARQRALAGAVYQRFVSDSVQASEAEIRALWETHKWGQHLRHILLADRNAAEQVRRELVSGRIAWSVAMKKYSLADSLTGPNGDLGWVARDKMDRGIANEVFALNPGELSKPLQDARGWHIVQSVERRPATPPVYEAIRRGLRVEIIAAKAAVYMERVLALLRLQTGMRYDTANAVYASRSFGATVQVRSGGLGTNIEIDGAVPDFTDADTSRLIARWKDGRFSLGDLLHAYSDVPPVMRPSLNVPEAVLGFVESIVLEPRIAEYGAQRGLERDPLVERAIAMKREELLVEHLYQDSVGTRVWVSKDERKAYYQKHLQSFFTYPSVDFAALLRSSKEGADSVERALRSGVPATAILAADSAKGRISGSIQHRSQNEQGAYHNSLFEEMRPGDIQVRGPDRVGDYAILQLLHYDGGRQLSFEESDPIIVESLTNMKSDDALQAMVARLEKRYEIRWRPELVMLIRLVDPTLD